MIESEVQRTLVKSPPELWTELSDPAALARHLGDLGEIRITRVEPEKLVEWEAAGTSGSVAIKASGWGTRVTLRATRELPGLADAAEPDDAAAEQAREPEAAAPHAAAHEPHAAAVADPADADADLAADAPPAADDPRQPRPARSIGAEIEWTVAERLEADEFEPLLGARRRLADEHPPIAAGAELEPQPQPGGSPPDAAPEDARPTRRGFFARLFGRLGRGVEDIPERELRALPDVEVDVEAYELPAPVAAPDPDPWIAVEPSEEPDAVTTWEEIREALLPEEEPAAAGAPGAETGGAAFEPEPAAQAGEAPGAEADACAAQEAAPQPEAAETPETAPARDLAAELRAAEEEVEAVLTAVLDRLGAAHHRPFSRA